MLRSTSRGGRVPLALLATALATLAGCTDSEPFATGPLTLPAKPGLTIGDVLTVTSTKGATEAGTLRWAIAQATGGAAGGSSLQPESRRFRNAARRR